jgi:hypothetical protein
MNGGSVGSAAPGADLVAVLRFYVDKMLREVPGMKVLLLDQDTTRVVSTVFSQSEILEQEVYLVEKLEAEKGDQLFHLKVGAGGCRGGPAGSRGCWRAPPPPARLCAAPAHLPAAACAGGVLPAAHPREHCSHPAGAAGSSLWRVPPV